MDDLIDWPEKPVEIFEGDALDYLRAVYQGRIRAEHSRMRKIRRLRNQNQYRGALGCFEGSRIDKGSAAV